MKKRILATILSIGMLTSLLAGCAAGAAPAAAPAAPAETEEAAAPEETAAPAEEAEAVEAAEPAETAEAFDEVTDIEVILIDFKGIPTEQGDRIVEEMNKITEKTAGVRAHVTFIGPGDYPTQVGLMLSGGEPLDIIGLGIGSSAFAALIANNQLMDITDLLDEYAPETLAFLGDYIDADSVNGRIYGVPPYRNYASSFYAVMRKDVLDELGLTDKAMSMTSFDDLAAIYAEVAEKTDLTPVGGSKQIFTTGYGNIYPGGSFEDAVIFDNLGDSYGIIFTDGEGNVSFRPEEEAQIKMYEMIRDWYDAGYVYKDSAITDDHPDTLTKAGILFSSLQISEMGIESAKQEATGFEVVCPEIAKDLVYSASVNKFGLAVPVTSQEPEAAIRWINAYYTDPALANLFTWGVEGTDYVVEDGVARFPDGVDVNSVGFHNYDFMYGNYFEVLPWSGNTADFRQQAMAFLEGADVSPYLGFAASQAGMDNIIAALNSVNDQYRPSIACGIYTDDDYSKYVTALKTAGAEEYVASYQEQLSAWMEATGK
ncbi:MAG: extracellular solute-binding protein [Lachnospiraceae bacterium]|nr:extracellular solute-binding protein [Lachnospiraceae bacterium]